MSKSTKNSKKSNARAHSDFAASSSADWLACPARMMATRFMESPESPASIEGSAAHALAELSLKTRVSPLKVRVKGKLEEERYEALITDEMRHHVKVYFDYCMPFYDIADCYIEEKFDLSHLHPALIHRDAIKSADGIPPKGKFTMYGTGDFLAVVPFGDIFGVDLKYGKGRVNARKNSQLAFYGLGGASEVQNDFGSAHLTIIQPRRSKLPDTWDVPRDELLTYEKIFHDGVEAALSPNPVYNPGEDQCHFCPIKKKCPARNGEVERGMQTAFSDQPAATSVIHPGSLTDAQIGRVLAQTPLVTDWLADVKSEALSRLNRGTVIPGYKLAPRRGARVWKDVKKTAIAAKKAGLDIFTEPELITPAQAEKLSESFVAKYSAYGPLFNVVVKESDPRPKQLPQIHQDFDDGAFE